MAFSLRTIPFIRLLFFLASVSIFFPNYISSIKPLCLSGERDALSQFNRSLSLASSASGDPSAYPKTASWAGDNCCSWDGVECDEGTSHVIGLDLSSSFLYGSINSNSSLFHLVHLQKLNLADNNFNLSQIPTEVGLFSSLTLLNLSASAFYGQVPSEITKLFNLTILDIGLNTDQSLNGWLELKKSDFRKLVQNMITLEELHLSFVSIFSSFPVAPESSSLAYVNFYGCGLSGTIPSSLGYLTKLRHINLAMNNLSGAIPSSLGDLTELNYLNLGENELSGPIPSSLGDLTQLNYLDLGENELSGPIPSSLGDLTQLNYLDLGENELSGAIPSSLGDLTELTYLFLGQNNLSGEIPSWLANLTQLETLSLSNNNFFPRDLSWLGKQNKLRTLRLHDISLVGEIPPSLRNMTQLERLYVSYNQLTGQIPSWLSNLTELIGLDLGENQLHGMIPNSIFNLSNLLLLFLSPNLISGIVKIERFTSLPHLTDLQLGGNNLTVLTEINGNVSLLPKFQHLDLFDCNIGVFPSFLKFQDNLNYLALTGNNIEGHIPKWFANVSTETLTYLDLEVNLFSSLEDPSMLLSFTSLQYLFLSQNKLQGPHPILPPSLISYEANNNLLTGEISSTICALNSLLYLELSQNYLSGLIPPCLDNLSHSLLVLDFANNFFNGSIPGTFANLTSLRLINLSSNQLDGPLPSLADCQMLQAIDLSDNHIGGQFPFWIGDLPRLEVLILRSNKFSGEIGSVETVFRLPKLRILDLSRNNFTGVLPNEFFANLSGMKSSSANQLAYLRINQSQPLEGFTLFLHYESYMVFTIKGVYIKYWHIPNLFAAIDLSSNRFRGDIPVSIGSLKMVNVLNLSNNHFSGSIPPVLGNISNLESLDLSSNFLSGEIPKQLSRLTFLEYFNVSDNELVGPIPQGNQFHTFENSSYEGNLGLCGEPLTEKCQNSGIPPPQPPISENEGSNSYMDWEIVLIGYGCGLLVGLVAGFRITKRKEEWFMKFFRIRQKRPRRRRERMRGVGTV